MKDCFIICPIGSENTDIRKRSDQVLNYLLKPVLEKHDFQPIRADKISKVGYITTQIINLIIDSPLVIADLSGLNPNVFYELAIRHAAEKPYIQIINKGDPIPFDIAGIRTIEVNMNDLDSVENSKLAIEKQIDEFEKGHKADSPISIAKNTRILQNDEELAEKIASNLEHFTSFYASETYIDDDAINILKKIYNKLWGFNEYSSLSLEDINNKIDKIFEKIDK